MTLKRHYEGPRLAVSFELFPPKKVDAESLLFDHVQQLVKYRPAFLTCTYGAGGSTRTKTLEICQRIKEAFQVPVASHLTLVGSTAHDLRDYLRRAHDLKIDYIVALRGDPPKGETEFRWTEGGFRYANELVSLIRAEYRQFGIAVAGYPETHLEAPSPEIDLDNLKRKVDAGADVVITQLFYDNSDFFRFVDRCQAAGIDVPIVPGILPITNFAQIQRLSSLCGARLPDELATDLARHDDRDWQFQVGVDFAIRQVQQLVEQGVPGIHFYVLNKSPATAAVLNAVAPKVAENV